MVKMKKFVGYVAPKAKFAALKCDCGFAMSNVSGISEINNWLNGGEDSADE